MNCMRLVNDILDSWRQSLSLLLPKKLKPFLLVTLKATREVYTILFVTFWWFMLGYIGLFAYLMHNVSMHWGWYHLVVGVGLSAVLFVLMLLAARPSLLKKDYAYFASYWGPAASFLLFLAFFVWVGFLLGVPVFPRFVRFFNVIFLLIMLLPGGFWGFSALMRYFYLNNVMWPDFWGSDLLRVYVHTVYISLSAIVLSPFIIFLGLYVFDRGIKKLFSNIVCATKMVLYNYPLLWILMFVWKIMYYDIILNLPLLWLPVGPMDPSNYRNIISDPAVLLYNSSFAVFVVTLLSPFVICFYVNLYIKNVHEYPERYVS